MKILQVMAGAQFGGAETAFEDMCIAMHQSGLDIHAAFRHWPARFERLQDHGVPCSTFRFGGFADITTKGHLKNLIYQYEPDIVQTWMARAARKTPHYRQSGASKKYYTVARLGGYYDLKYFKTMDYFAAVTPKLKDHIADKGVPAPRIRQLNNFTFVDEDAVPVSRKELDTPAEATVLLSLARYHKNKALDILIKALPYLPNAYLWLAGEGPEREALQKLAKKENVADRVRFLGWRGDRAALLKAADICTFVSRHEPFGTVFVQAWAHKTPLIVSGADGPAQYCTDNEDSLMVEIDNIEDVVNAVKRLEDDSVLRMRLANAGYKNYMEHFSKDAGIKAYLNFYESILQNGSFRTL